MSKFAPKGHLAASVLYWEKIYTPVLQQVHNKIWKSGSTWYGVKEGAIDIAGFGPMVSNNEKMKVLAVRDKFVTVNILCLVDHFTNKMEHYFWEKVNISQIRN